MGRNVNSIVIYVERSYRIINAKNKVNNSSTVLGPPVVGLVDMATKNRARTVQKSNIGKARPTERIGSFAISSSVPDICNPLFTQVYSINTKMLEHQIRQL